MLLDGKVVLISGVGPGMGRKMACIAAAEGARVALAARSADLLAEVVGEIEAAGGSAIAFPTDVTRADDCRRIADAALAAWGRIDGLINSAFRFKGGLAFAPEAADEWRATFDVTLFGTINMIQAVLPAMKQQRDGSIVNISTRSTMQPIAGEGPYVTSKAALHGLTRQLAVELGPHNIRVNAPRMGWLWGEPVKHHLEAHAAARGVPLDTVVAEIARAIPLGFLPPDEDCARAVLFFVSDYARVVTGTSLDVNGGQFMA